MSVPQDLGRDWADSQWARADASRRARPLTLSAEMWLEVVLWASEANLTARDIFEITKAARVRWKELQAGARGGSGGSRKRTAGRYLGSVE